jgi:hypothetical protein
MKDKQINNIPSILLSLLFGMVLYFSSVVLVEAASLSLSPSTGVYTANGTFSVQVLVNTDAKPINAADGTLSFNPRELSVVSVNRTSSIFNLWVTEPTFSNSAGTVSFSGGLPSGYTGAKGNIMTITFKALGSGTVRVSFTGGSVLANDGRGTNVLSNMNGGTFTIQAQSVAPLPEIIEYVAPANTPAAPVIISDTHGDSKLWYTNKEAILNWTLTDGVIAVRTVLDDNPTTIPTKVYDTPIKTITLSDLPEGESYFHIQFKNKEGWGRVTHYRLAVDSQNPTKIEIIPFGEADFTNPNQILSIKVEDETSLIKRFKVKVDSEEPFDYLVTAGSSTIPLPTLQPGYHTVIIEAFDEAGNSIVGSYSVTIEAFDKPVFTEFPSEINEEVIPVIKGKTRPNSNVEVTIRRIGSEASVYKVTSDNEGVFIFIPEGRFTNGVYELSAQSTDEFGAKSDVSNVIRIAVQQPGFIRVGSMIVSVLSVVIPLLVLTFLLVIGTWYLFLYARRFKRRVRMESTEALEILHSEFSSLQATLHEQESILRESRRTKKLTEAEIDLIRIISQALLVSQERVEKEIEDVTDLTRKKNR